MKSYKETKEYLKQLEDYRSFQYRSTRLPEMVEKETKHFKDVQEFYKEEGFNHLSVVEIIRTFIKVDILKLSLMQSTHGIYVDGNTPQYPSEAETVAKFTLETSDIDFYQLILPEDLEKKNEEIKEAIISFNRSVEPFLQSIEKNAGDVTTTVQAVITELFNSNPHILSKIYDETYYETVLNYMIDNAFENTWKQQKVQTPLVSFYAMFTLSFYDNVYLDQLV
ncbi:hypothetical protein [Jeotgalicoccus meleagridis]|jgi:hypothetical protein|uniref:Uncharacterized protein n=1 Tax=Jeotgalicoccus meleagridis TaxID=2759181 RepID=A0A6V7RMN1_9STAP|nr:hypothetical protein [Jeotgalicoccus meleagridis]CAD2078889.1 hypothetical protein JEODO184_01518 [Jeotgalicoccus meleagridis]